IELVTVGLSSFYCDLIKDRLYCDSPDSVSRRSAQTVLHIMARDMSRALAPVLSFTSEDVWQHLPDDADAPASVFLAGFPTAEPSWEDSELLERWSALREIRRSVTKVLEDLRRDGIIGNALQASVTIKAAGTDLELVRSVGEEALADICLVSDFKIGEGEGEVEVDAKKSDQPKCPRCWRQGHGIGSDSEFIDLCGRCAQVMKKLDFEVDSSDQ
ncbi:MAG: class I tRNA ligase family protein, partial [Proteobacteria bacterium]|nr:class I tRNA ligase family protein [Pseudomonadota bacterium]